MGKNVIYDIPSLEEIDKELDRRHSAISFREFAKRAWHVIEPATELKWNWAMDAICDHLQAVTEEQIFRLLMNVPPGTSKSTLTGVLWPCWEWTTRPHHRYLGTSHRMDLAIRDNMKCRRLITSSWYQDRWSVPLVGDSNQKGRFENTSTGFREAMPFTSMTGSRGSRVILDDPISVDDANSEAALLEAERAFTETLPTRVNNDRSAIVVVMQRIHSRDVSGIILEKELDYEHLCLPMEFEPERKCYTSIGFEDPRTEQDELLFPDRFPPEQVKELKKTMGAWSVAGQFQQRPVPRSGGLFNREWLQPLQMAPADIVTSVRGYDIAATATAKADHTASVKIGLTKDKRIVILDVWRGQMTPQNVRSRILQSAAEDGVKTRISIPQDPGSAGKGMVEQYRQDLIGYDARFSPETGSKIARALPLAAQAEAGAIYYVVAPWNSFFLDEMSLFPNAPHDDMVDAASRAFNELLKLMKTTGPSVSVSGPRLIN